MNTLKIFLIFTMFIITPITFGNIYIGDLQIDKENPEITKTFEINNIMLNETYRLEFTHYGVKTKNITMGLYLNNNLLCTIGDNNSIHTIHTTNTSQKPIIININNYIRKGKNNLSFKLTCGDLGNGWGYKINDAKIYTPSTTVKTPIPTSAIIISILVMVLIILKWRENNSQ